MVRWLTTRSERRESRFRRALTAAILAGLVLSGCHVQTDVRLELARNGSGAVTVTVTADADVAAQAPGLADDFRGDDLLAAGWSVTGPAPTADGGLSLVLTHPFATPDEATSVLAQLSSDTGPFQRLHLVQDRSRTRISSALTGAILVPDLAAFADAGLAATLGEAPYAGQLQRRGLTLDQAFGLTLTARLPGEVDDVDGTAAPYDAASGTTTITWTAALAGNGAVPPGQPITARAVLDDAGARQADRVHGFAQWALAAWLVFFGFVIVPVVYLRRRRGKL